jgi:Phage integrase, N-terminal SAM-like domain
MTPLRRRMIEDMTLRNFTTQTIRSYVWCVARFACHFNSSPEHLGPEGVRAYLVYLVQERRVSLSYYKQTRVALGPSMNRLKSSPCISAPLCGRSRLCETDIDCSPMRPTATWPLGA